MLPDPADAFTKLVPDLTYLHVPTEVETPPVKPTVTAPARELIPADLYPRIGYAGVALTVPSEILSFHMNGARVTHRALDGNPLAISQPTPAIQPSD
jgi:hypothetical protein